MSNYVKATNFYAKDALLTGNPDKIIKGAEIDAEYNAIATAVNSKADTTSPTFTGTPIAPTAASGTNTTQLATTAFVTSSQGTMAAQNKTAVDITGGTIVGITDLLPADGGTGVSTITPNAVVIGNGTGAITSVRPDTFGNVLYSSTGATVTAGSLVEGTQYTILTVGVTATNWVAIGAADANIGTVFIKNSTAATGNGTATTNVWTSETVDITPDKLTTATGTAPSYSARAFVNFDGVTITTSAGTYAQAGTTVTVTLSSHGYRVGDRVSSDDMSGTAIDGMYTVATVPNADTYTYTAGTSLTTGGTINVKKATIRSSSNVSSIAYLPLGVYGINFTTAMTDANYACTANCSSQSGVGAATVMINRSSSDVYAPTAQSIVIFTRADSGGSLTAEYVNAVIFA